MIIRAASELANTGAAGHLTMTGLQRADRALAIRPARGISRGTKAPAGQDGWSWSSRRPAKDSGPRSEQAFGQQVCSAGRQRENARERRHAEQHQHGPRPADALGEAPKLGTVVVGLIGKAASILMLGSVSSHSRRDPQAQAAKARAGLVEAEAKVAEEQDAVIARALHEDEAQRRADLEDVAEKEAEAVPWNQPAGC